MHQILRSIHPNAKSMNGLASRVASALARPWQTGYVAPTLRTLDAVAYAIRGYDVYWTPVSFDEEDEARNPSSVCYRIFKQTPATHNERVPSHGAELSTLFPGWAHAAEMKVRWGAAKVRYAVPAPTPSAGTKEET